MINLINYLWEGALCLTILWLFYKVFLERTTFFAWNRTFLLSALSVALVFPALNLAGVSGLNLVNESFDFQLPTFEFNGSNQSQTVMPFSFSDFLVGIYFIGALFLLTKFLVGIISLIVFTRKAKSSREGKYTLLEHPSFEPSSFFHLIFLPEGTVQMQQKVRWIIAHEKTHADYQHSMDKLLLQVVKIVFWFYPIHRLYEAALEVVHEYQVDEQMTQSYPIEEYARLLIHLGKPKSSNQLVHNFNKFQIKKRLTMMTQPKSKCIVKGLYAFALPVFICLFALISCEQNEDMQLMQAMENESDDVITKRLMKEGVFDVVEDMPLPQGGLEGWNEYLSENLKYPQAAREAGLEGTVYLVFTVTKEGALEQASVLRGPGEDLNQEALRMIEEAPNWIPGKQNGENLNVKMRLPIRFKLN